MLFLIDHTYGKIAYLSNPLIDFKLLLIGSLDKLLMNFSVLICYSLDCYSTQFSLWYELSFWLSTLFTQQSLYDIYRLLWPGLINGYLRYMRGLEFFDRFNFWAARSMIFFTRFYDCLWLHLSNAMAKLESRCSGFMGPPKVRVWQVFIINLIICDLINTKSHPIPLEISFDFSFKSHTQNVSSFQNDPFQNTDKPINQWWIFKLFLWSFWEIIQNESHLLIFVFDYEFN